MTEVSPPSRLFHFSSESTVMKTNRIAAFFLTGGRGSRLVLRAASPSGEHAHAHALGVIFSLSRFCYRYRFSCVCGACRWVRVEADSIMLPSSL